MKNIKEILLEGKNNLLPWSSSAAWIYVLSCIAATNDRKLFESLTKKVLYDNEAKGIMGSFRKFVPKGFKLENINDLFDILREFNVVPEKSQLSIIKFN